MKAHITQVARKLATKNIFNYEKQLVILYTLGLLISLYLLNNYTSQDAIYCGPIQSAINSCDVVKNSGYSSIAGVQLPVLGIIYFTLCYLILLIPKLFPSKFGTKSGLVPIKFTLFCLGLFGFVFESYYTFLQFFVIEAICIWCLGLQVVLTCILVYLFFS